MRGIDRGRLAGKRNLVFVTAHDQYAIQAFEQGALDYLVKPVDPTRLAETVTRLQQRLIQAQPTLDIVSVLQGLTLRRRRSRFNRPSSTKPQRDGRDSSERPR
jgi:DNA-binding LytR/AlgR family response regulator